MSHRRCSRPSPRLAALGLLSATVAVSIALPAGAQSPLSLVNIGQPTLGGDARLEGRGGWGMAESDTLAPAFKNLAGLPGLRRVALSVSGFGETIASSGPEGTRDNRRVMAPDLRLAVPLRSGRAVFTAGFRARRSTQYDVTVSRAWTVAGDTVALGDEQFVREGTQFAVPLGATCSITPALALAAGLSLERGAIRERISHYFLDALDSLATLRSSRLVREDRFAGLSATLSARYAPLPGFALGAAWSPGWDCDVTREVETLNVVGSADTSYTLRMPPAWSLGASWRLAQRWSIGADYDLRQFSRLTGRPDWESDLTDEWFLALGCERSGSQVRRGGWRNLPLRLGATVGRWGYRVGGEDVREWRVAAGTGFNFRDGGGRVDLAVSYGRVGSRERNGYGDEVWRLAVSVIGLEKYW